MKAFIDEHLKVYGGEPIYKVLPIAPSTDYLHVARATNPELCSTRAKHDEALNQDIRRVWKESIHNYGARKAWIQLKCEGMAMTHCTNVKFGTYKASAELKPSRLRSAI